MAVITGNEDNSFFITAQQWAHGLNFLNQFAQLRRDSYVRVRCQEPRKGRPVIFLCRNVVLTVAKQFILKEIPVM